MKNKKVFVTVAVSLCLLIIASLLVYNYNYGKIKAQKYSESITQAIEVAESNVNFETTVQNSTAAVTAEFVSYREDKDYMTYKFKVIDILYGKVTESEIEFRLSNMGNGVDQFGYNSLTFNEGDKYKVYIYQLVREDENSLYGFKTQEEKDLFLKLISVKGLGCKMALPILATGSIPGIVDAIERENILYLKKFPKIGDKVAKQIILDLKGKLNIQVTGEVVNNSLDELVEVLEGLGYKSKEIKGIVTKVDASLSIEDQVKEALKLLLK